VASFEIFQGHFNKKVDTNNEPSPLPGKQPARRGFKPQPLESKMNKNRDSPA
jgi:hypothetical protein